LDPLQAIPSVNHNPRNFLCATVRDFVAGKYRSASSASTASSSWTSLLFTQGFGAGALF